MLRYWETEFGFLSPQKNEGNQRFYTRKDLEKVLTLKRLLHEERFTIAGAKKRFRQEWRRTQESGSEEEGRRRLLQRLKAEVEDLIRLLGKH